MGFLTHLNFKEESLVYPGIYIPLDKQRRNKTMPMLAPRNKKKRFPSTKIREVEDLYIVETSLPSARREDFLARAYGNRIMIEGRIKVTDKNTPGIDQMPEPEWIDFNRKVLLPQNADTEFVRAEYSSGMLRFYIPKISRPAQPMNSTIVVY